MVCATIASSLANRIFFAAVGPLRPEFSHTCATQRRFLPVVPSYVCFRELKRNRESRGLVGRRQFVRQLNDANSDVQLISGSYQFNVEACVSPITCSWRQQQPNSPQKPTSRRMPRPPAEPARSVRDGRRHAACRSLRQNLSFLAASGAPLVRSRVYAACSLTSDPLGGHHFLPPHVSTAQPRRTGRFL